MRDGAAVYGVLMGVIGVGSIVGSFGLNRWKNRFGPDRLAAGATGGTILALLLFDAARGPVLALLASFIGGASWVVMMTSLFMSAQVALPDWVQGRGIAVYLTTYFGSATVGAALWGKVASLVGGPSAQRRGTGISGRIQSQPNQRKPLVAQFVATLPGLIKSFFRRPARGGQSIDHVSPQVGNHLGMRNQRSIEPVAAFVEFIFVDLPTIASLPQAADNICSHEDAAGIVLPPPPAAIIVLEAV